MMSYFAILLFNSTRSMGRGLSVHLTALMISKGKERLGGLVGDGEKLVLNV